MCRVTDYITRDRGTKQSEKQLMVKCTCMGKQGVSWLQVWVQSAPVLKAAVLGLWGVCTMSWSIHWPHSTSRWDRVESREMLSLWVNSTSWDTSRTWTTNKQVLTAADRPEDEWALLLDSYWRQSGVMVGALWVPASGRPPRILILRRQPAGIRDVCSPPSGMLSKQDKNTTDTQLSKNNKNLIEIEHVATCVLALTCCCTLLWWICNAQTDSRSHSWVSAAQRSSPSPAADSLCRLHSAALWEQTVNITPKSYK